MALKLNVSISRKIGMPDYGSAGASCSLEVEIGAGLPEGDPAGFQARIRDVYDLARQAVQDELVRLQALPVEQTAVMSVPCRVGSVKHDSNGHAAGNGQDHGTRGIQAPSRRPATAKQVRVILAIARRRQVDLSEVLRNEFDVEKPEELSLRQASWLIDRLKTLTEE